MTEVDRIRLAEAMGWKRKGDRYMIGPKGASVFVECIPDPFTDANDDYAVLEWIRSQGIIGSKIATQLGKNNRWSIDYKIGDYAIAALKVIE